MVRFFRFSLLIGFYLLLTSKSTANSIYPYTAPDTSGHGECMAPPPDSFRVTCYGYDFFCLAWNPSQQYPDHLLTIFQENNSNGWDSLYSVLLENANSYTVENASPERRHKVTIKSVCENGEPGTWFSNVFPGHGLILELTLGGRNPSNPTSSTCIGLPLPKSPNDWIGFKVEEISNEQVVNSTTFEFVPEDINSGTVGYVKRVEEDGEESILVAANYLESWPNNFISSVQSGLTFKVGKVTDSNHLDVFGFVTVTIFPDVPRVDICADSSWRNGFTFLPLVSKNAGNCPTCPNQGKTSFTSIEDHLRVENPASNYLHVFFDEEKFKPGNRKITLKNINGASIFTEDLFVTKPELLVPIGNQPFGIYIVYVESNQKNQLLKLIIK